MRVAIFGYGWLARHMVPALDADHAICRLRVTGATMDQLRKYLIEGGFTHVLCFVGKTRSSNVPSVDYLELPGKLPQNVSSNLTAPLLLAALCAELELHMTYFGTGCIFDGDVEYLECDEPNFQGSSYSTVKGATDVLMRHCYPEVLNVRIRMPIVDGKDPYCFIAKIRKYSRIISRRNSVTYVPEAARILVSMMHDRVEGTMNLVQPEPLDHEQMLRLVDPHRDISVMTLEDQAQLLGSQRSNNTLSTARLVEYCTSHNVALHTTRECLAHLE